MMSREGYVSLRVPTELHQWLAAEAEAENRTLNNFIETVLLEYRDRQEDAATREILQDSSLMAQIRSGLADLKSGKTVPRSGRQRVAS